MHAAPSRPPSRIKSPQAHGRGGFRPTLLGQLFLIDAADAVKRLFALFVQHGGSTTAVAKALKIDLSTVKRWRRRAESADPTFAHRLQQLREQAGLGDGVLGDD